MCVSILAVASSNTNIEGLCAKILAKANNCFCPAENDTPLSFATSSIPFGNEDTNSSAEDSFTDSCTSSSDIFALSFILSFIVLAKINGSCKIIPICCLKLLLFIFLYLHHLVKFLLVVFHKTY